MSAVVQQFEHVSRRKKYSNDPLKSTLPHFIPMGTGAEGLSRKQSISTVCVLAISQNFKSHFERDLEALQEVPIQFFAGWIRLIPRGCLCFGFL